MFTVAYIVVNCLGKVCIPLIVGTSYFTSVLLLTANCNHIPPHISNPHRHRTFEFSSITLNYNITNYFVGISAQFGNGPYG